MRAGQSGDRIPVGATFSALVQTGPGAHPASYTMGTGSFLGVKRPGRGVDHPPPSSAEVEERVELYLYSPAGPSWPVLGWILHLTSVGNISSVIQGKLLYAPFKHICQLLIGILVRILPKIAKIKHATSETSLICTANWCVCIITTKYKRTAAFAIV